MIIDINRSGLEAKKQTRGEVELVGRQTDAWFDVLVNFKTMVYDLRKETAGFFKSFGFISGFALSVLVWSFGSSGGSSRIT